MSWQAYKLIFRLETPLHIGYHKLGNIQRTRWYVTGRVLWGALTANLVRINNTSDYVSMGKKVNQSLAFSYLYPTLRQDGNTPLYPHFRNNQVVFGEAKMKAEEFEFKFISSYASTALDYFTQQAAKIGSLHEVEFISPKTKDKGEQVYLTGYLFVEDKNQPELQPCREALGRVQLGGERKYGFGRLSLATEIVPVTDGRFFSNWEMVLGDARPVIKLRNEQHLLAHTLIDSGVEANGTLEPLVGRETRNQDKFGTEPSEARICWVPGTVVNTSQNFRIGDYGIWEKAST